MEIEGPKPFHGNNAELTAFLKKIFNNELNSMACAIAHLCNNLPEMAELAAFTNLRFAFEEHQEESHAQLDRILIIFEHFDIKITEDNCFGMKCVIEEAYSAIQKTEPKSFRRDMALIFYAQIIENIVIASYNMLKMIATRLGYDEAKVMLNENLHEAVDSKKLLDLLSNEYMLKAS